MSEDSQSPDLIVNTDKVMPDITLKEICEAAKIEAGATKVSADLAKAAADAASKSEKDILESQSKMTAVLAEAQAKLAEIMTLATQAVAANTKITDHQVVVATKSDHIQKAQEHADKVRADLDRALTAATQQVTGAEGEKAKAQSLAEAATKLLADIQKIKGDVDAVSVSVASTRKATEESAAQTKGLADKSVVVEDRISKYEQRLTEIDQRCAVQLKMTDDLLRGATSAGLATAFDKRRQTFLKPNNLWQGAFVGSVLLLVVLAVSGLWHVYGLDKIPGWGELARLWLARLPIAGALIWLALHASRESALAKRLEEDYGYKAAIASCFEGFRKQMSEIDTDKATKSQLAKLCENTLSTIASPPGRIYAAHKLIVSPVDEISGVAKVATDTVTAVNSSVAK